MELILKETIDTKIIIRQKSKDIRKTLFLKISKFLLTQLKNIKFKFMITRKKSGMNGPEIKNKGIDKYKIAEKFIILFLNLLSII